MSTTSCVFIKWHTHHIYIDSNHVNLNKKYAYSANEFISSWIDDLTLSNFLQHWSSSLHANCDLSAFSLIISNSIYSSSFLSSSLSSSSFSALITASSASTIVCSNIYARAFEVSLRVTFEELHEELHEKKFSRIACMFHWRIKFTTKDTCYEHMRQSIFYVESA